MASASQASRFSSGIASSVAPQAYLEPLGHDLAQDGPRGTISGVIAPTAAAPTTPPDAPGRDDLPLLRPRDAHARDKRRSTDAAPVPQPAATEAPGLSAGPGTSVLRRAEPVAERAAPLPRAERPEGLPRRPLAARTYGPSRATDETDHRSDDASPASSAAARGAGSVDTSGSAPPSQDPAPETGTPTSHPAPSAQPARGRSPDRRPLVGERHPHGGARSGGGAAGVQLARDGGTTSPARSTRQRPGLGEPLGELPATARRAPDEFGPRPRSAVAATGREAAVAMGMEHLLPASSSETERGPTEPTHAAAPQLPRRPEPTGPVVAARSLDTRVGPHAVGRQPAGPLPRRDTPPAPRALIGARAPSTSSGVLAGTHRASEPDADTATDDAAPSTPVPVRWAEATPGDAPAPGSDHAAGDGGMPADARGAGSAPPSDGQPSGTRPAVRLARAADPSGPSVMPASGPSRPTMHGGPAPRSPEGTGAPGQRDAGPAGGGSGDGATSVAAVARSAQPGGDGVARGVDASPTSQAMPPVQRAVVPVGSLDDVAGEGADAPDRSGGDEDVGELASRVTQHLAEDSGDVAVLVQRLYPQLRDELRWELRTQRERAGLLADPL